MHRNQWEGMRGGEKRSWANPKMHSGEESMGRRDVDGRRDSGRGGGEREGEGKKREGGGREGGEGKRW